MTPTYLVAWMYVLVIVFSTCTYIRTESPRGLYDRSNYPTKREKLVNLLNTDRQRGGKSERVKCRGEEKRGMTAMYRRGWKLKRVGKRGRKGNRDDKTGGGTTWRVQSCELSRIIEGNPTRFTTLVWGEEKSKLVYCSLFIRILFYFNFQNIFIYRNES